MDQEVTNNTITAPGALADLVAVAGNEEVLLIWQAPTSGGQVESYEYRYAQGSTIPPVTTWNDAGTATRFIVTSLTNEQLHTFEVRAKNRSANGSAASVTETPVEIPLPVVSLSQTTYTVREGPNASVTVTINVSNLSTREIRVRVSTAAGTATTPLDFTNVLDTVTFVPGQNPQTSQTRRIPIQNDQIYEHEETFTVQLARIQGSPNFTIPDGMGEATVTIEDDEAIPTLQIADASAAEGGVITFTIQYKQITQGCINAVASSVDWAATIESGDTASADDLTIADSTLSLSRCRLSRTFTVQTTQDIIDETHETFTITLSNPVNAQLDDDPTATGTILDDDDAPSGPTNLEASVGDTRTTLSWDSSTTAGTQPITHHEYRSRTNITDYGDDWTPIPDSVPTGNNATSYRITGLDNQTTYTFQVRAINAAGPSAHATSNDVTPIPAIIEFVEMTQSVAEDAVNVQITLKASHPPASRITVSLSHTAPESGRAADVDDYRQGPSTIAFPPNSVEQNLNLIVTEDQKVEGTESFIIHIHSAPGATIGDQSSIRVDILDNDVGLISFFKEQAATPEGDPIHLRVDLTCPNPVMGTGCDFYEDLTIFYTIAAVTATQDDDYTLPDPLEVLIPAGEDIATIVIPTVDDEIDDDDETFTVTLSRTSSPLYPPHTGGGRTSTVTIRDNDTRGVTVHPTELHVPETRNATYTVVLDTEPTGNVTVTPSLAADGDQDITLQSTAALTFTPDNWRQPQSVQVNAADDIDEVNGQRVINHTVAGADYASEPGPTVTAKEVDDEINIPSTGAPSITGTPQVGSTLTADTSGIEDEDGNTKAEAGDTGFAYTYRWIQVDSDHETTIAGAESKTYVPVPDDAGKTLKVAVSFTDDGDNAEGPLNSGPTTEVLASRPSAVTDLAAEFGDARVALTWTRASNGGSPVTKHSYRLKIGDNAYRNWTDIPDSAEDGNNNTSYTVGGLNNNTTYTFQVRAVNAEGIGPEATSNEVTTLPSTIQFERSTVSVVENNEGVHVCLMASHPPSRQISIELRYAGAPEEGTAIPGVDFLPEPERFEYPANRDRACDDVPIIKDGLVERAIENFFIYLVDAPGAVIGENASLEVSILDIETATVEIAPQSTATEGSPLSFTITLSQPFTLAPLDEGLTVTYTTEHGTTQGDDYTTPDPLEFLIPTGATTATLEIPTTPDHVDEDDETFTVTLTTTSHQRFNILETATTANATILDNDTAGVSLSRQRMLINEGRSSTYSVVLTSRPSTDVTIEIAGQTTHITLDKHTLTFIPDDWNKAQTVTVRGALEDETTNLTHTATSGDADYQGVSIASLQVEVIGLFLTLEAPADQGAVRAGQRAYYSIRMGGTSEPLDEWVSTSMDYRWRGGGIVSHVKQAIEGSLDLDADGNKFTWTSYTVVPENHTGGALTVALRMEDEYEIGDPPSVCIDIIDANGRLRECSEPTGEPRIWAESELVQEGQEPLRFKVVLEHRSEQTVTVNYETFNIVEAGQDHTALAGEDYTAKNGTLTFQPGELEKIVLVTVLTDDIEENEEYVGFRLSNFSGARPRQGWVEIVGAIIDPGT